MKNNLNARPRVSARGLQRGHQMMMTTLEVGEVVPEIPILLLLFEFLKNCSVVETLFRHLTATL